MKAKRRLLIVYCFVSTEIIVLFNIYEIMWPSSGGVMKRGGSIEPDECPGYGRR